MTLFARNFDYARRSYRSIKLLVNDLGQIVSGSYIQLSALRVMVRLGTTQFALAYVASVAYATPAERLSKPVATVPLTKKVDKFTAAELLHREQARIASFAPDSSGSSNSALMSLRAL